MKHFRIRCPGCDGEIIVDKVSGEVLSHKSEDDPLAGGHSFDSLFSQMDEERSRAEELFDQEKAAHEDRDRILKDKFEEAFRQAEEKGLDDETPPERPWDLD